MLDISHSNNINFADRDLYIFEHLIPMLNYIWSVEKKIDRNLIEMLHVPPTLILYRRWWIDNAAVMESNDI